MIPRIGGYTLLGLLFFLGLLPILAMVWTTVHDAGGFSLHAYSTLWQDKTLWKSFQHSFLLALTVAFSSTFVGTSLAILLGKTNLYTRTFWLSLLLIPLLLPPYIVAYGWYGLLGREGMLGHQLFSFVGTAWVLFTVYLSIPTLIITLFLRQINPRLEEAGLLYSTWRNVLIHISLPLIQPAIVFSFLLVFILTLSEFSVANFLRFDVFPLQSFTQFSAFYDFKMATVYTMPLLLIVLVIVLLTFSLPKKSLHFQRYHNALIIDVFSLRQSLNIGLGILLLCIIGLPLWGLLRHIHGADFLLAFQQSLPSLLQSLFYATMASIVLLVLGFTSALVITYRTIKAWQWLQILLLFFFVLSSVLLGIALILFWNHPWSNFIYGTATIVLIAYGLKYLFLTSTILQLKLRQIPSSLIESAQLLGASHRQILTAILLPLSKETLIISALVGFIFALRESTLTMLVAPAGTSTLPLYIMTQMANGKESIIASLCLIMIGIVLVPLLGLLYYTGAKDD